MGKNLILEVCIYVLALFWQKGITTELRNILSIKYIIEYFNTIFKKFFLSIPLIQKIDLIHFYPPNY